MVLPQSPLAGSAPELDLVSRACDAEPSVYVVDDDKEMRDSMRLLAHSVHLNVETYATAQAFLDAYRPDKPGCLVADVCLPGMSGVELLEQLRHNHIHIPVIIITAYGEIPLVVRAMKAGAWTFVEKPFSRQEMIDQINLAIASDMVRYREASMRVEAQARLAALSEREREILRLFIAGKHTKKIANALDISPKTVDYHRWKLLEKMGVKNMVELAHLVGKYADEQPPQQES